MQVCVLGPLLVRNGAAEVAAGGPLQRRVLARLALDAGRPVDPSELEAAVWGDDPPVAARHTIATHVFRLRRLGLAIETADDRYLLRTPTDVDELEQLAAAGRQALERPIAAPPSDRSGQPWPWPGGEPWSISRTCPRPGSWRPGSTSWSRGCAKSC
jgi:DNA-binding SARP family transcriptional activator